MELNKKEEKLNRQAMFGSRNTLTEAFDYAKLIVERSPDSDYVYNMTALMVIWNTLADSYEPLVRKKIEEDSNGTK
tara:strand:+ start:160 stop:387 length:228 start_codon:yes stop_codon:yes gene_type:complete